MDGWMDDAKRLQNKEGKALQSNIPNLDSRRQTNSGQHQKKQNIKRDKIKENCNKFLYLN